MIAQNTDIDRINFGLLVKKHREAKGYTQHKLANLMSITGKSVGCIERGENYPTPENIFKLASILEMSLDEFVFGFNKFDETISIDEINEMLQSLTPEHRKFIIYTLRTMCKALVRFDKK